MRLALQEAERLAQPGCGDGDSPAAVDASRQAEGAHHSRAAALHQAPSPTPAQCYSRPSPPPETASPPGSCQDLPSKSDHRRERDKRRSGVERSRKEKADPYSRKSSGLKRLQRSIACALYMAQGADELHKTSSSFVGGRRLAAGLEKRVYGLQEAQLMGLKVVRWDGM